MIAIERGKLIPVSGENDTPDMENAIDVQFNPVSLKVSLSNTLKENSRSGSSRSAQFVDKSSSSLAVELIFDTTYVESAGEDQGGTQTASSPGSNSSSQNRIEQGSDVRLQTKKIAEAFIKPVEEGDQLKAPKRCLFQWGAFEFLGLVQKFDETLDFFSPEGRPLRATVSIQLSEDRYQFRNREVAQQERNAPSLSSTGAGPQGGANQSNQPVSGGSGDQPGNWRDTSLFNGIESPRLPSLSAVAIPKLSISASLGISAGLNVGASASFGASANIGVAVSASAQAGASSSFATGSGRTAQKSLQQTQTSPAFRFGNSSSLGTGIEGAFSPAGKKTTLNAGSLQTASAALRIDEMQTLSVESTGGAQASTVGTTKKGGVATKPSSSVSAGTVKTGVSVAALLKAASDQGVGFD